MALRSLILATAPLSVKGIVASLQPRREVQGHGFSWEKDLLHNVYGVTNEEIKAVKYTNKMDLPSVLNRLDGCDVSIKTTCSANAVCMADCLRIFDSVTSGEALHMVVVHYKQEDERNVKSLVSITEVDLTSSGEALFGEITRPQLEELAAAVKSVPHKRKPTAEEYMRIYSMRDSLQVKSGAIHMDIKCNSTQSRLQCSFNHFQEFLEKYPERVVAYSNTNEFRGGKIEAEIVSSRRTFKKHIIHPC